MPTFTIMPFHGFEWDDGNRGKCQAHGLSIEDIEWVLMHAETLIVPDGRHSGSESRFIAVGKTSVGRYAFVVFTPREDVRGTMLRPISARYMHRKEIERYEKEISGSQNR
jgi:uncharacterized DUF497 family protein